VRIGAVAVVAGTLAALPLFAAQSQSSQQRGVSWRLSENRIAVAMFADHPIAGVGPDRYTDLYRDYARRIGNDPRARRYAHSLPLQIAAEQGVVGVIGWLTALVLAVALALRRRAWEDPVARTFVLALATYLFGSLFLHGSQLRIIYVLLGAVLAMAFHAPAPRRGPAMT
jgi:O-antigen ligase